MKQRPSLLFTHSQYSFITYLHAQIIIIYSWPCITTVFKIKKLHDKIWFNGTYTQLKPNNEGFRLQQKNPSLYCNVQGSWAVYAECMSLRAR